MYGVGMDGKILVVNKDFTIRVPHGAGYDLGDPGAEDSAVLSITRFEAMPENYKNGPFDVSLGGRKLDIFNLYLTEAYAGDELGRTNYPKYLEQLKQSVDARFAWAAVGSAAKPEDPSENFRVLRVVQNTPDTKAGYITNDLFVSVNFMVYLFTREEGYKGTLKIERQAGKLKRTEMFMRSLLSSIKPNNA